ncbi:hypothetical protein EOM71_00710 [Candidatus Falkowbacteria bacterium]|jgi:hypothetical protein|nr:hypothetical protein [Candidatus Falkowbacteria bacterium]
MTQRKTKPVWRWLIIAFVVAIIALLSWLIIASRQPINMDELGRDNLYHYRNQDLNFNLDLPEQFIYYQTERTNSADYKEIKFFVPTSDPDYLYESLPSYAKPIVVRVYLEDAWNNLSEEDENKSDFQKITVKNGQVYLIWFWERQPKDWQDKWSEEMKEIISQSLR